MGNKQNNKSSLIPTDLVQEYVEIGADKLVEESKQYLPILNDVGAEIPYVKTLIAVVKMPHTVGDFILGKKVYSFLYSSGLDKKKIDNFKKKFSKVKQESLWERVVFSINAHDDKLKSEITGKLFAALIDGTITEDEFFMMVHATNTLNIHILDELKRIYMLGFEGALLASQYYSFATLGLIDIDNSGTGTMGNGGPRYPLNQLGWKYMGLVYDYPESSLAGLLVGKDELVLELDKESSRPTGRAFPMTHIQSSGLNYREIDIFIVRQNGEVLCDEKDGLPLAVASKASIAGESPEKTAQNIAHQFVAPPVSILLRKMEDTPVQKWVFIVKSGDLAENSEFRLISDIKQTINDATIKDDQIRYYLQLLEQIDRHVNGELRASWDEKS